MELVWSPAAVGDLNAAADYVEFELASPMTARRLIDSVIAKAQLSADVPGACQLGGRSGREPGCFGLLADSPFCVVAYLAGSVSSLSVRIEA